jgi:hypothetical protein
MDTNAIAMYKEHNTNIFNSGRSFSRADIDAAFSHEGHLFNSIEDGISVLDRGLNIISVNFTMQKWYSNRRRFAGKKCYEVYHDRSEPCENCPIIKAIDTGTAQRDIVSYHIKKNGASGWHELQGFPILEDGQVTGVVEYVKDITCEVDLYSKICDIEKQMGNIREQNELLQTYIEQMKDEKKEIEHNIADNVNRFVKPVIKQMKEVFTGKPMEYEMISFLDTLFQNILTPYLPDSTGLKDFTSREIQIMSMIRAGKSSKEIASLMDLSQKTVDFHRANIRKKLGLKQGKDNLRAHLISSRMALE